MSIEVRGGTFPIPMATHWLSMADDLQKISINLQRTVKDT
jgi:hypothetical protein